MPWIQNLKEVSQIASKLRDEGKKIVTTNGCFDFLHFGHIQYLEEAREMGDALFVGINSDASIRKLKGPDRPVQSEDSRAKMLSALSCVDITFIFDEDDPRTFIKKIKPQIHVKGGDYGPDIMEREVVESVGGQVVIAKKVDAPSTTEILTTLIKTMNRGKNSN